MKTIFSAVVATMVLAFAFAAFAFGPNAKDSQGYKLQQIQPANTNCTTIVSGRATTVTVSTASSPYIGWKAFDSAGAGVVVKRALNGGAGFIPTTGETSLAIAPSVKTVAFSRYSGNTSINFCYEK